ncbi:MAG: ABC transporter substrate-binding protein [Polyangiales bacterium]
MKRRAALLALGALGAYGSTRIVRGRAPSAVGRRLIVVTIEPTTVLTSAFDPVMTNCLIGSKVMEGLVTYDVDLNPVPALAERWEVSPDGRSIRFHLRPNVKWHDGADFTSEDVAFTLLESWKKLHPFGRAAWATVRAVQTPDPLTVDVHLEGPARYIFGYLNTFGAQVLPKHLYAGSDIRGNPHNQAPVGTGPFVFQEWQRGSHVRLRKNPHYWRPGQPRLDEVIFRFIPDAPSRAAALQSGEVQLALGGAIPHLSLRRFAQNDRFQLNTDDGNFLSSLSMVLCNVRSGALADRRVRQALMHAIDREALLRLVFRGYGKVATGPVPSSVRRYYTTEVPQYPYDLARARGLLKDAGHADMRLQLAFGQPEALRTALFLRQSLAKIGVTLELKQSDATTWLRHVFTDQEFQLALTGLHMLPDPTLGVQRLYWGKNIHKGVPWTNGSGYLNPELDAVMEAAQIEGDEAERRRLMQRWQQIVQTDLPVLNLIESAWVSVSTANLQRPTRQGDGLFDNLGDAYFA